jgi:hypothetical protein
MTAIPLAAVKIGRRLNKIQQKWIAPPQDRPWAKIYIDEMDGKSWRSLSMNARRMYDALICQHYRYCQGSNGELQISYTGFKRAGITNDRYVRRAQDELIAAGKISLGRRINPDQRQIGMLTTYELLSYRERKGFAERASRGFVWIPLDVMESPAWCGLSINARRIMDRLLIENHRHRGEANGKLRISYRQLADHGIGWRLIKKSVMELIDGELIEVTNKEWRGCYKPHNLYRITFLGTVDGPATWKGRNVIPMPKKPSHKSWKEVLLTEFKKRGAAQ